MKKSLTSFSKLLKICIQLESKFRIFINYADSSIEWKEIEAIAFSINELLCSFIEEIPIKSVINSRKLAGYVLSLDTFTLHKDSIQAETIGDSRIAYEISEYIREIEDEYFKEERDSIINDLKFSIPKGVLPDDITEIINLTYQEVLVDFTNGCYFSAISICGKIIETILSALYREITNIDPDEEKLGMDAIINRLKKLKKFEFKGLQDQINIIKHHRNKAIHGNIIIPTIDESRGIISLTRDLLQKAFSKNLKS